MTFNVCGINNLTKYEPWKSLGTLREMFDFLQADVICFQETKLQSKDLVKQHAIVPGFHSFFSFSRERKGYSGVVIYVRDDIAVIQAEEGLTGWLPCGSGIYRDLIPSIGGYPETSRSKGIEIDGEGRVVVLDLGDVVVFGAYCPANSSGDRTDYREEFFELLDARLRNLMEKGRNVLLFGDINVCRELIDSAELLVRARGTRESDSLESWTNSIPRKIINELVNDNVLVDVVRDRYKDKRGVYTQWNQMLNSRPSNYGNRLDLILVSPGVTCTDADIVPELLGSDHCPVYADLVLENAVPSATPLLGMKSLLRFKTADLNAHFKSGDRGTPSPAPPLPTVKKAPSPKRAASQKSITAFFGQPTGKVVKQVVKQQRGVVIEPSLNRVPVLGEHQEQWRSIFKREVPQCLHNQDCKLLVSKKPGKNKGRAFWVCQK